MRIFKNQISLTLIAAIVFIHFTPVSILGFPLTLAPFAILVFLLTHFKLSIHRNVLYLFILLIFAPIIIYIVFIVLGGWSEPLEFMTTYLLWIYAVFGMMLSLFSKPRIISDHSKDFITALLIVVLFSVAQVLFVKLFSSALLYQPFGDFSYMGGGGLISENLVRAPGLFLEPSFNAFIMFFLASVIVMKNPRIKGNILILVLSGIGVLVTTSIIGVVSILGLIFFLSLNLIVKKNKVLFYVFILLSIAVLITLNDFLFTLDRFNEINTEGTSGYWRLIAPLIITSEVLFQYPLGVPFGHMQDFIIPLGILHGGSVGSTLDNGMYVLLFYFGWLGVYFVLWMFYMFVKEIYHRNIRGMVFWWFVIFSLQFSGGIFLPEYMFFLLLVIYQYRNVARFELYKT
jgi:putative colanic acid polymerase